MIPSGSARPLTCILWKRSRHNQTLDRADKLTERLRIVTAANSETACYAALCAAGFVVRREVVADTETWIGERGAIEVSSTEGLCALLGLASLAQQRGASWRATDEETDAFMRRFYE